MAKRRRFTPEFKETEVVIEALSGESSQAELCRKHSSSRVSTSVTNNCQSGNANSLKTRRPSLNLLISR